MSAKPDTASWLINLSILINSIFLFMGHDVLEILLAVITGG